MVTATPPAAAPVRDTALTDSVDCHLRRRPPLRVAALAVAAALMLHGIVLSGLPAVPGDDGDAGVMPSTVRVRTVIAQPLAPGAAPAAVTMPPSPSVPAPPSNGPARRATVASPSLGARPAADVASAASAPASVALPGVDATPAIDHAPPAATPAEAAAPVVSVAPQPAEAASVTPPRADASAPAAAFADSGEEVPVYATAFAPSQVLAYHLKRGLLSGTGTLRWQHDGSQAAGARYELLLEAKVAGFSVLTQRSEGGFDAAGLAPRRFTDQRLRGSTRAANFQRERGVISFSGPSVEFPVVPGVQDRLSWMLQLPAIVEAAPQRAAAGERITLYVIGARGDAAVWTFRFVAPEVVSTDAGDVPALKFIREPRQPNDTQAEVWLDPAQHHLPVRARLGNPPDGDVLDLVRVPP